MAYAKESKMSGMLAPKGEMCPPCDNYGEGDDGLKRMPYVQAEVRRLSALAKELEDVQQAAEAKFLPVLRNEPVKALDNTANESSGCDLADELNRINSVLTFVRLNFQAMLDRCEL